MPVAGGFIEADVIRWKEPVFKNRRRGRPARLGDRLVTAEVLPDGDRDGWVHLLVRRAEVVSAHPGWNLSDVLLPATGTETKRQRRTIIRGNPERMAWTDEGARAAVVASQFLGDQKPALPVFGETGESYPLQSSFNPVSCTNKKSPGKPRPQPPGPGD